MTKFMTAACAPLLLLSFVAILTSSHTVHAQKSSAKIAKQKSAVVVPFYGNKICPVEGKKVNHRWAVTYEGQKIYSCCRKCWKQVRKKPAEFLSKAYPSDKVNKLALKTCPIMGKKLKANPTLVEWQGYSIPVCCKACKKRFLAEPSKNLTLTLNPKLKHVKNTMCPIMPDEKVIPDLFFVYKNQLVNICCDSCVDEAKDDPEAAMKGLKK